MIIIHGRSFEILINFACVISIAHGGNLLYSAFKEPGIVSISCSVEAPAVAAAAVRPKYRVVQLVVRVLVESRGGGRGARPATFMASTPGSSCSPNKGRTLDIPSTLGTSSAGVSKQRVPSAGVPLITLQGNANKLRITGSRHEVIRPPTTTSHGLSEKYASPRGQLR